MAVNWFEGGRRITLLLQGAAVLLCAGYVAFGPSGPQVILETTGPDKPFTYTTRRCRSDDGQYNFERPAYFGNADFRTVQLCFRGDEQGVPWRRDVYKLPPVGNPPREMPPLITYKVDPRWSTAVYDYMAQRASEYPLKTKLIEEARSREWEAWLRQVWYRFEDSSPWAFGFVFALWILTTAIGFIVRGFAGIPSGKDFRPDRT